MANISVTNALNDNSATSDITKVGTNFTDLVNGLTDGTKDISVSAITAGSTLSVTGIVNSSIQLLVGSNASASDFSAAKMIVSQGNSGQTTSAGIGVVGEAISTGAGLTVYGVYGVGKAHTADTGVGVTGIGLVNATGDTGGSYGGDFSATATHAGGSNIAVNGNASGGATNYSFYGVAGTIYNAGDIYTTAWTDYGGTSSIVGWSSRTVTSIFYKKVGKSVRVQFNLDGTSNSTDVTFTLPYTNANDVEVRAMVYGSPASGTSPAQVYLAKNSSTVTVYKDIAANAWTASGTKQVSGEFFFEATA